MKKIVIQSLILLILSSCQNQENIHIEDSSKLEFSHIMVGFPRESDDLSEFTDTIKIDKIKNSNNELILDLLGKNSDSTHLNDQLKVKYTKNIGNEVTQVYYGNYSEQYMAYIHDKFGLIFLTQTDWEKNDFFLVSHPNFSESEFKPILIFCRDFHKTRKDPLN